MATTSPLAADAVAGITDAELAAAVAEHWELTMRWTPTWATTLGDHRYDDQLAPRDADSIERYTRERDAVYAQLCGVDPARLGEVDRVTYQLLRGQLEAQRGLDVCRFHEWLVDSAGGSVLGELSYLVESHTVKTARDAENLVARMRQGAKAIDDTIANLGTGLAQGRVSSAEKVRRVVEQVDAELAKPVEGWAMAIPAWAGDFRAVHGTLVDVVRDEIAPAIARLRDFLRERVLPAARTEHEGLGALPDGDACYRATIVQHVGIAMSPAELHALGLAEIARTDAELAELGRRVLGAPDLKATIAKLRDESQLYFASRDEILAFAQDALDRAKAAIPRFFRVLPKADCVMREIPSYEAPYSTIAYYRQPHYDGSKPGEYFVNTFKPETRPRFELEALTWHESIPGHHLQIAIAQELGALPAFRKLDGSTAFVEGWALYTERLAEEMGLYSSDVDRLGKVSYDAWRASRLVVDTGIHAMGWTRQQAEGFMREHTALTPINISNEVDRYIGWPGQALAYKVGQLKIIALREEAERALGAAFDLPGFHEVVLAAGAVTLPVLEERVRAWVSARAPGTRA
ncbi:MAG TPA: DUF885 domain-containing protein [Kofleriaceae bacterium]|nr:DUF885 domain-containing protein [Kofleriaceae bacterium]